MCCDLTHTTAGGRRHWKPVRFFSATRWYSLAAGVSAKTCLFTNSVASTARPGLQYSGR
jgi:hypothetical protein